MKKLLLVSFFGGFLFIGAGCNQPKTQTPIGPDSSVNTPADSGGIKTAVPVVAPPAEEKSVNKIETKPKPVVLPKVTVATPIKFSFTTNSQDAVFYISRGWTGGFGEAVLDAPGGTVEQFNGTAIYINSEMARQIYAIGKLPECYVGRPTIKVSARIKLALKTGVNSSIEDAPKESYYEAVVEKLSGVYVEAEECKD
jgi:hypothetical protein